MKEYPIYLINGDEEFLKNQALESIKLKVLNNTSAQFNYNLFYAEQDPVSDILTCAGTLPFISNKRLVVVKNIDWFKEEDKQSIISYCRSPLKTTVLVLVNSKGGKDRKFFSALSKFDCVCKKDFSKLYDNELKKWIADKLRSNSKKIEFDAVNLLTDKIGHNMYGLSAAIDKLLLYLPKNDIIKAVDVEKIIGRSAEDTIFSLVDEVASKNVTGALKILKGILTKGRESYAVIGMLGWHFKRMWKAKDVLNSGGNDADLMSQLKIKRYFLNKLKTQLKHLNINFIKDSIILLTQTDQKIKKGQLSIDIALEILIIRLCMCSVISY